MTTQHRDFFEKQKEELDMRLHHNLIPSHMHDAVRLYILYGIHPGDFVYAIFSNDFIAAASRADDLNQHALFGWACLVYNLPIGARDPDAWMERKGWAGILKINEEVA